MNYLTAMDFVPSDDMNSYDYNHMEQAVYEAVYNNPPSKVQLVALAIAAQEINGEYCKRGGKSDFVETYDEEADEVIQRFRQVKAANRTVMEQLPVRNPNVFTPELMEKAEAMLAELEMDYMFKVLADNMNDFETSINDFLADKNAEARRWIGVVAYIPEYVKNLAEKRALEERSANSKWLGSVGETLKLEVEIINSRVSNAFPGYNVKAITTDGNCVSFFTSREDVGNATGVVKVSAKVKNHAHMYGNESVKETRLNYVKLIG